MTFDIFTFSLTIRHFNNGKETGPSLLSQRLLGLILGHTELKQWKAKAFLGDAPQPEVRRFLSNMLWRCQV